MAEMNDRSSGKPETAPLTSPQLAIADIIGMALAQTWQTSIANSQDHSTTDSSLNR